MCEGCTFKMQRKMRRFKWDLCQEVVDWKQSKHWEEIREEKPGKTGHKHTGRSPNIQLVPGSQEGKNIPVFLSVFLPVSTPSSQSPFIFHVQLNIELNPASVIDKTAIHEYFS